MAKKIKNYKKKIAYQDKKYTQKVKKIIAGYLQ